MDLGGRPRPLAQPLPPLPLWPPPASCRTAAVVAATKFRHWRPSRAPLAAASTRYSGRWGPGGGRAGGANAVALAVPTTTRRRRKIKGECIPPVGRPRATARDDAPVSCPPLSTLTHNAARSGTVTGGHGCENPKCAPTVKPRQLLMQRRTAARLTCHRKISATDAQSATPCACARWGCVGGHIGCRGSPPRRAWLTTAAAAAGRCARVARRRRRRTGAADGEAVPNGSHRVRGRRSRGVPRACGAPRATDGGVMARATSCRTRRAPPPPRKVALPGSRRNCRRCRHGSPS